MADIETSAVTPTGVWDFTFIKQSTITTLADEGTPTVLSKNLFKTGGTTTITDFDDGVVGQTIVVLAAHSLDITHNASIIKLNGAGNFSMTAGMTLTLTMFDDQVWVEVARSDNT